MELRDFFTDKEITAMKDRIVKEACLSAFLDEHTVELEDGSGFTYKSLRPFIENAIREQVAEEIKAYVREVIDTSVKNKVAAAAEGFAHRLCDQLGKISEKTNWYWSIK